MARMEQPELVRVKLSCARAGHSFDAAGRNTGVFSQAAGDVVSMPRDEAQRHFDRGLASPVPEETNKRS